MKELCVLAVAAISIGGAMAQTYSSQDGATYPTYSSDRPASESSGLTSESSSKGTVPTGNQAAPAPATQSNTQPKVAADQTPARQLGARPASVQSDSVRR